MDLQKNYSQQILVELSFVLLSFSAAKFQVKNQDFADLTHIWDFFDPAVGVSAKLSFYYFLSGDFCLLVFSQKDKNNPVTLSL